MNDRGGVIVASCTDFDAAFPGRALQLIQLLARSSTQAVGLHERIDGRFPDGEVVVNLPEEVRNSTVVVLQSLSTVGGQSHDAALLALLATVRAYREYGAGRVLVVVPHLAYSRQDRRIQGELRPLTSRLISELLTVAGADRVLAISAGAVDRLAQVYNPLPLKFIETDDFVVHRLASLAPSAALIAPDGGATRQVHRIAARCGRPWAGGQKVRLDATTVELRITDASELVGLTEAILVDDLICSAGTMVAAADELKRLGFERIWMFAPHLRLTEIGMARLSALHEEGLLCGVYGTDSIPTTFHASFVHRSSFMTEFGTQILAEIESDRVPVASELSAV